MSVGGKQKTSLPPARVQPSPKPTSSEEPDAGPAQQEQQQQQKPSKKLGQKLKEKLGQTLRRKTGQKLEELRFDNTYARLGEDFSSRETPQPLREPRLVSANPAVAELLDIDPRELKRPELVAYFSGKRLLPGSEPIATVYAGHQFGGWNPRLGDGRSLLLGELLGRDGERYDLHLKGAGQTKWSRFGDGRAVLRSSIREYLAGEALHALGVPTTRSLCLIASSEPVSRERMETGANLARVARSHIRFGHFEYFRHSKKEAQLDQLLDYTVRRHFPEWSDEPDRVALLFENAVVQTALTVAAWQAVGFAHGVLNTDNMSILGDTLDFGPYGFLDAFDPGHICNHSDHEGRYAFDKQPSVGLWNCSALATALDGRIPQERVRAALDGYQAVLRDEYLRLMRDKMGLAARGDETDEQQDEKQDKKQDKKQEEQQEEADLSLIGEFLGLLATSEMDYARSLRMLAEIDTRGGPLRDNCTELPALESWSQRYLERLRAGGGVDDAWRRAVLAANPRYTLRNHLAQRAIEHAERGDYSKVETLLGLLQSPFEERPGMEEYSNAAPEWSKKLEISCSS